MDVNQKKYTRISMLFEPLVAVTHEIKDNEFHQYSVSNEVHGKVMTRKEVNDIIRCYICIHIYHKISHPTDHDIVLMLTLPMKISSRAQTDICVKCVR